MTILGKERISFSSNKRTLFRSSGQKKSRFVGLKAEAEKHGLGRSTKLEFLRLEKAKEGSEAFSRHWNNSRQLDSLTAKKRTHDGFSGKQRKSCATEEREAGDYTTTTFKSGTLPLNMYRASNYPKEKKFAQLKCIR